jgi:hypothetical protein
MSPLRAQIARSCRAAEPTPCSPNYFLTYLSGRWAEGSVRGRQLFQEIKLRGYTGGFSHLERLLATWRGDRSAKATKNNNDHTVVTSPPNPQPLTESASVTIPHAVDPATGWLISLIVAATLCIKPRGLLTPDQVAKIDALKRRLAGVHDHARSRNAVSRHFLRKRHRQTRRVAGRRAAIRHLCDAAHCAHVAKRYRRCEECCDRVLEQRPDRRADQ